jgi:hypothetical protein
MNRRADKRMTNEATNPPPPPTSGRRQVPDWNAGDGMLHWRGQSKHFRPDAVNARAILGAFQHTGWCDSVENPLPEDPEILRSRLLETTVSNLNRVLNGWGLRLHAEGKGARVRWEAVV